MAKRSASPPTDDLAAQMRAQEESLTRALQGHGAQQQVMAGFADAYRAWMEAMSAHPESLVELQARYMQEQLRLWSEAMHGAPADDPGAAPDKRFSGPEWNQLPVFRYLRDSY